MGHLPQVPGVNMERRNCRKMGVQTRYGSKLWRWRSEETGFELLPQKVIYSETSFSHCDMLVMTVALPSSQVIMKIREKGLHSALHTVELLRWEGRE